MFRFVLLAVVLAAGTLAFGQDFEAIERSRPIEIIDRGAQDRWQIDQDLIRARRDAMVDRELRFTEELQAEIRRRAIERILSDGGILGGAGGAGRGEFVLDRSRAPMIVAPVNGGGNHCILRRLLGGGIGPQPQQLILVPVVGR